ncbi:MAG: adenosine kinase [Candidatus Nanoarchaeia archaeon]|nr:adenosine kinase [Candidatus Nanoarchaeia archaeon]
MKYDVYGIGTALIDFQVKTKDEDLLRFNISKGIFKQMTKQEFEKIYGELKESKILMKAGGSCANTIYGFSLLGGKAALTGKIGDDKLGDYFEKEIGVNVKNNLIRCKGDITGNVILFSTPDKERSFAVYLGAGIKFKKEDLILNEIKESKILHVEGYQLEHKEFREAIIHAMDFAKKNNVLVSLDVSDAGVISRNKELMINVLKNYVDVVFANEDEAKALTGKEREEALDFLGKLCNIAVVKIGKEGCLIKNKNKIIRVPGYKVKLIDSAGAGDMYAAGFLYGLSKNYEMETCGRLGNYFAAKVVERIGARLDKIEKEEINRILFTKNI